MSWTKKYDEFALICNFSKSECAVLLARYMLRRSKLAEPTEIEIDLHHFNKWVGKQRILGQYHRKTLSTAIAMLDERSNGMFVILKRYNPWIYKMLVRPLCFVEKIQGSKCARNLKTPTGNPMFDGDHKKRCTLQQQQNISKLNALLTKVGLKYDPDALNRIWRLAEKSIDNVSQAVELLLARYSTNKEGINNPAGYLIEILKKGYYKNFNLYYDCDLPWFRTGFEISTFVLEVKKQVQAAIIPIPT